MNLTERLQALLTLLETFRLHQQSTQELSFRPSTPGGFESSLFTPASPMIALAHVAGLLLFVVAIIARN